MKPSMMRRVQLSSQLRAEAGQLTFAAAEVSAYGYKSAGECLLRAAEELSAVADTIDPDKGAP